MKTSIAMFLLAMLLAIGITTCGIAHEPKKPTTEDAASAPRIDAGIGLVLPDLQGPKPWSDKPHLNDPDRFQIAIVTDRTGGHRPGIWEEAVKKINLLRPEFVVSVGDLIEGYSEDPVELETQWKEFLGFVDDMEMKFFFVPGNHDVSNPVMHDLWRKKFGPAWYSFDYKRVHFVCLCSEDPETTLGEEQLKWLEQDLAEHQEARWTLVFLHKPLWVFAERELAAGNKDSTNWKKAEALLGDRPHSVFAGHVHHYTQYDRSGHQYIHLATTGGSSQMRGIPYGEFDQVAWLTMEQDGPHVANLLLDGILAPDAINEKGIARFRSFLANTPVEVAPILLEDAAGFTRGQVDIRLTNAFDAPITLDGILAGLPLQGLTVNPERLHLVAGPGTSETLSITVEFTNPIAFERLASTFLTAKIATTNEVVPLTAERQVPVVIDRGYPCPAIPKVTLDGNLEEWGDLPHAISDNPLILGAAESWQGRTDAGAKFKLAHDDQFLYVALEVTDDRLVPGDGAVTIIDPRPIKTRLAAQLFDTEVIHAQADAPAQNGEISAKLTGKVIDEQHWRRAGKRTSQGYNLEFAFPISALSSRQGAQWHSLQMTVYVRDIDQVGDTPCQVLWRGTKNVDKSNAGYAYFMHRD